MKRMTRNNLLDIFTEVGAQFDLVSNSIYEREKQIDSGLKRLIRRVNEEPWEGSILRQDHHFKNKSAKHLKKARDLIDAWVREAEGYDKRTKMRKRFDDSLLIFVFGKVKAGKSSLGNFFAYGDSNPNLDCINTASPQPEFFWEAGNNSTETMSSEAMEEKRCFGVGAAETTSSIQGFTLPGLTWVDSPGVHSRKAANEKLTKEYAEAADVIVFLSNSSEPGRRSDIEEIKDLLGQGKPLLVIITASDRLETDVDDAGKLVKSLQMKSDEDREGQIVHVLHEMEGFTAQTKVLTISLKYAESGAGETKAQAWARWQASGMEAFSKELASLALSQGVTLKRTTPLRNLKNYCQALLGVADAGEEILKVNELSSLRELNKRLEKTAQMLADERISIKVECDILLPKIRAALTRKIKKLADDHVMDDAAFRKACMVAFTEICDQYASEMGEQFISPFAGFDLRKLMRPPRFPNFEERFERHTYTSHKAENVGKALGGSGGALGGAMAGAALGSAVPLVGTAIGGFIGGVLGSIFGGGAGGAVGENFNSSETVKTKVGDNRGEVVEVVLKALVNASKLYVDEVFLQLDQLCFENLDDWLKKVQSSLNSFQKRLETQINEINQELRNENN
jgi:tRNA U34 5-carboxymethylaminomethyl modifying GTPase MnmE/TrmE